MPPNSTDSERAARDVGAPLAPGGGTRIAIRIRTSGYRIAHDDPTAAPLGEAQPRA